MVFLGYAFNTLKEGPRASILLFIFDYVDLGFVPNTSASMRQNNANKPKKFRRAPYSTHTFSGF
jgi:hypothetical protein